jgi:coenzyme PQQ precursor peptide PqqA
MTRKRRPDKNLAFISPPADSFCAGATYKVASAYKRRGGTRRSAASPRDEATSRGMNMTWTAPEACEICIGMEVTSYMSAEI